MHVGGQVKLRPAKAADSSYATSTAVESFREGDSVHDTLLGSEPMTASSGAYAEPVLNGDHDVHHSSEYATPRSDVARGTPRSVRVNRLLFSDRSDPDVLLNENSRLSIQVDERNAYIALLKRELQKSRDESDKLRSSLLTARSHDLPKADMAAFRKELDTLKAAHARADDEAAALEARNIALATEVADLREAFQSRDELLKSVRRSLDRKEAALAQLQQDYDDQQEQLRREEELRESAQDLGSTQQHAIATQQASAGQAQVGLEDCRRDAARLQHANSELQQENDSLRQRLHSFTEDAVKRQTFDSFDEYRRDAEAQRRDLESHVDALVEEVRLLRDGQRGSPVGGPDVSAILPVDPQHDDGAGLLHRAEVAERHSAIAARCYHSARLNALCIKEEAFRAGVEQECWEGHSAFTQGHHRHEVVQLLRTHAASYDALAVMMRRNHALLKEQIQQQVKPLVDRGYRDGYRAALAAAKARRRGDARSKERESNASVSDTPVTHTSSPRRSLQEGTPLSAAQLSHDDHLRLFEVCLSAVVSAHTLVRPYCRVHQPAGLLPPHTLPHRRSCATRQRIGSPRCCCATGCGYAPTRMCGAGLTTGGGDYGLSNECVAARAVASCYTPFSPAVKASLLGTGVLCYFHFLSHPLAGHRCASCRDTPLDAPSRTAPLEPCLCIPVFIVYSSSFMFQSSTGRWEVCLCLGGVAPPEQRQRTNNGTTVKSQCCPVVLDTAPTPPLLPLPTFPVPCSVCSTPTTIY